MLLQLTAGVVFAVFVYYVNENLYTKHPVFVDYDVVDKQYKAVYDMFR